MQSYIFSKTHTRWTDLISRHTKNIVNFDENSYRNSGINRNAIRNHNHLIRYQTPKPSSQTGQMIEYLPVP